MAPQLRMLGTTREEGTCHTLLEDLETKDTVVQGYTIRKPLLLRCRKALRLSGYAASDPIDEKSIWHCGLAFGSGRADGGGLSDER